MPGVDYEVLRREITIRDVLELLHFEAVRGTADQLRGACPVHRSTSPRSTSFSVSLAQQRYRCFKCGSRGNQLELWAAVHNMPIHPAAVDLCRALGREVPWIRRW